MTQTDQIKAKFAARIGKAKGQDKGHKGTIRPAVLQAALDEVMENALARADDISAAGLRAAIAEFTTQIPEWMATLTD